MQRYVADKKINEGEIQQYYVENRHPSIITPEVFELVQEEVRRRKSAGKHTSAINCFASKIVCRDLEVSMEGRCSIPPVSIVDLIITKSISRFARNTRRISRDCFSYGCFFMRLIWQKLCIAEKMVMKLY